MAYGKAKYQMKALIFLIPIALMLFSCGEGSQTLSDDPEPKCSVVFQKDFGYT